MNPESKLHKGHRQRMREKLITHGSAVFQTYELLEMLLFYIVPYKNTNPIAKRLMLRFSDVDSVFSATKEELMEVEGVGSSIADFLITVGRFMDSDSESAAGEEYVDYKVAGEFFTEKLSDTKAAKTAVLLLDNKMRYIGYSVLFDADYSSAAVKVETIIEYAIKNRASVVMTAHSHPFGPLFPTPGDMVTNELVSKSLTDAGVGHIEHYIVCGDKYKGISRQFSLPLLQIPEIDRFLKSKEEN